MNFSRLLPILPIIKPIIKRNNSNTGLTLIELLLGSALTSFVVGVAGWGLVHIMATDQKASAKQTIQYNSNRALEFLSQEIRLARKIDSDAVAALAEAPDFTLPAGAKPIIVFQVPDVPQRIIYYTRPVQEGDIWEGPNVIERWGPILDETGQYDEDEISKPDTWQSNVLIDSVHDEPMTSNCPPDWQASHVDGTKGFNACVDSQEKLVSFNLATTVNNPTWHKEISYEVKTTAFARSRITQGFDEDESAFTVIDNKLIIEKPANIKFEVLGGALACYAGGDNIPVNTYLYKDGNETAETWDTGSPLTLPNQPAGTTFDVESVARTGSMCGGSDKTVSSIDTDSVQIRVLVDGDSVPDGDTFDNQTSIDVFLREYIKDGKISLADNQAIYLFELWGDNESASYFDLQDNVVLATVDSTN